jgi:hypothetical protein
VVIQAFILLSTAIVILLLRVYIDRRSFKSLGFSFKGRFKNHFFAGIGWGIGLITVVFLIELIAGGVKVTAASFPFADLIVLFIVLVMAAIYEEIVLRGYLLNNLMQSVNKYLALILISVVFAAFHGFNPNVSIAGLVNIILAGLLLGVYYIHQQNLWLPITLHIFWNFFQGPVYGSPVSGANTPSVLSLQFSGAEWLTGGKFGFEASVTASIVIAIAIIALHLVYRNKSSGQPAELPSVAPGE